MTNTSPARPGPGDRRQLGAALRAARKAVSMSGETAGERVGKGQSAISKYERGSLLPTPEDVAALCVIYGVPAGEREELVALATALKSSSRMILTRAGATSIQRRVAKLEQESTRVRAYQPLLVFGLLQTERYIQRVFGMPNASQLTSADLASAMEQRRKRQERLSDPSRQYLLIMTEGSLRWHVGSPDLMAEQVEAIAETAATLPNVRIGIIPWTTPVTIFPLHGFHLYDDDAVLVATESATGIVTTTDDLVMYNELMTAIEAVASFGADAQEHFARIANDYRRLATSLRHSV